MRIDVNVATGDPSGGLMPDLSEAQLFYCGATGDCRSGSNVQILMDYARDTGAVPDTNYPYDGLSGCRISLVKDWKSLVTKISGWKTLNLEHDGAAKMKEWISTNGPLAAAMFPVYEDFQNFTGDGVYKWNGSGLPSVCIYSGQTHYCYRDTSGNIQDVIWTGSNWTIQQVAGPGSASGGPAAAGDPCVVMYSGQMHYCYRDSSGNIQDVIWTGSNWTIQQVAGPGSASGGPAAAGDPFVIVWSGTGYNQMHYCYRDSQGCIWDAQWTGSDWIAIQVTGAGGKIPGAPAAAAGPVVFLYSGVRFNQMHYCYRDKAGYIQDAFWNGSTWGYQTI
jgi:hypothetical protein